MIQIPGRKNSNSLAGGPCELRLNGCAPTDAHCQCQLPPILPRQQRDDGRSTPRSSRRWRPVLAPARANPERPGTAPEGGGGGGGEQGQGDGRGGSWGPDPPDEGGLFTLGGDRVEQPGPSSAWAGPTADGATAGHVVSSPIRAPGGGPGPVARLEADGFAVDSAGGRRRGGGRDAEPDGPPPSGPGDAAGHG